MYNKFNLKKTQEMDNWTYSSWRKHWRVRCGCGMWRGSMRGSGVRGRGMGRSWCSCSRGCSGSLVPSWSTLSAWCRCLLNCIHASPAVRSWGFSPPTVMSRCFCWLGYKIKLNLLKSSVQLKGLQIFRLQKVHKYLNTSIGFRCLIPPITPRSVLCRCLPAWSGMARSNVSRSRIPNTSWWSSSWSFTAATRSTGSFFPSTSL